MNTDRSLSELRADLEQLDAQRELLSSRLFEAAQRLESPGEPPADELIDGLSDYRQRVHRIGTEIGFFAQTGLGQTASSVTLAELRHAIDQLDRREHVLEVLDQILALTHVETNDFAPLVACHAEARRLKRLATIAHGIEEEAELEAIGANTHPFNQLIRLSEEGSSLSDADWIACNDAVTAAFGRQLATALARGRIVHGSPATDETEPPIVEKPQPTASISPPAAAESSSFLTMTSHPIVIEEARGIASGPIDQSVPGPDSIFEPSPLEQCVFEEQTPRPKLKGMIPLAATGISTVESLGAGIPQAATRNASSDATHNRERVTPADRSASLTDHTRRLLAENRLPLAMHLTRSAELGVKPVTMFPPSWMLRAVIVSEHLSESRGELARQLDDDLKSFRPEMLADSDDERQMACGFFLRAAALPAALICGSPAASSVLRAFKIAPGFSQGHRQVPLDWGT